MSENNVIETNCPLSWALSVISGKWKIAIIWLLRNNALRFNELQKNLPNITQKTLTQQLRELERDGMVSRKVYPEVPPKVEYSLTELGRSIKPALVSMCRWGRKYRKAVGNRFETTALCDNS